MYADAVADFAFPFQMEQEDRDLTVNSVADFEDSDDLQVETVTDIDVPLNELVSGMVSSNILFTNPFSFRSDELNAALPKPDVRVDNNKHIITLLYRFQVSRVEDYGAFITISYNGKEMKGFLERDEAKVCILIVLFS